MMPSMGRIVFYHFENLFEDGTTTVRTRPALVVDADAQGFCVLHVFFSPADQTFSPAAHETDWASKTPDKIAVPPHREATAEIGWAMREQPKPGTWSWPPRVG